MFRGIVINERTCGSYMKGLVPAFLRGLGYRRAQGTTTFFKHMSGVGGSYFIVNEDHIRIRVKEVGIDVIARNGKVVKQMALFIEDINTIKEERPTDDRNL